MNRVFDENEKSESSAFKDMFKNIKDMFKNIPTDPNSTFASVSINYKNGKMVRKIVKHSENIDQEEAEKMVGDMGDLQKEMDEMNKEMKNFFKDME